MYRKQANARSLATGGVNHVQLDAKPTVPPPQPLHPLQPTPGRPTKESVFHQPKSEKRKKKFQRG